MKLTDDSFAGTVEVSYFPEASGNFTYPSTYYNPALGITMYVMVFYFLSMSLTRGCVESS